MGEYSIALGNLWEEISTGFGPLRNDPKIPLKFEMLIFKQEPIIFFTHTSQGSGMNL